MKPKISIFALVIALCGCLVAGMAYAGERVTYESPVMLSGTLVSGLGETPDGKPVNYPALSLGRAITVNGTVGDDINGETESVKLIQLVLTDKNMAAFKKLRGGKARVNCSLFHSHTGYHYTKVLCEALSISR